MKTKEKIEMLRNDKEPNVDIDSLYKKQLPDIVENVVLRLATAIHYAESTYTGSISWSAQKRAAAFFDKNGMYESLKECERLENNRLK